MAIARTVFLALLLALGVAPLAEAQSGTPLFIAADMVRGLGEAVRAASSAIGLCGKKKSPGAFACRTRPANNSTTRASKASSSNCPTGRNSRHASAATRRKRRRTISGRPRWTIPEDYPTGTFNYKVVATALDGTTQTWEPVNTKPSLLTIVAGTFEPAK